MTQREMSIEIDSEPIVVVIGRGKVSGRNVFCFVHGASCEAAQHEIHLGICRIVGSGQTGCQSSAGVRFNGEPVGSRMPLSNSLKKGCENHRVSTCLHQSTTKPTVNEKIKKISVHTSEKQQGATKEREMRRRKTLFLPQFQQES